MLSAATPSELTIRYAEALAAIDEGSPSASQELLTLQAKKAAALKLLATMPKCGVRMDPDVSIRHLRVDRRIYLSNSYSSWSALKELSRLRPAHLMTRLASAPMPPYLVKWPCAWPAPAPLSRPSVSCPLPEYIIMAILTDHPLQPPRTSPTPSVNNRSAISPTWPMAPA